MLGIALAGDDERRSISEHPARYRSSPRVRAVPYGHQSNASRTSLLATRHSLVLTGGDHTKHFLKPGKESAYMRPPIAGNP